MVNSSHVTGWISCGWLYCAWSGSQIFTSEFVLSEDCFDAHDIRALLYFTNRLHRVAGPKNRTRPAELKRRSRVASQKNPPFSCRRNDNAPGDDTRKWMEQSSHNILKSPQVTSAKWKHQNIKNLSQTVIWHDWLISAVLKSPYQAQRRLINSLLHRCDWWLNIPHATSHSGLTAIKKRKHHRQRL